MEAIEKEERKRKEGGKEEGVRCERTGGKIEMKLGELKPRWPLFPLALTS